MSIIHTAITGVIVGVMVGVPEDSAVEGRAGIDGGGVASEFRSLRMSLTLPGWLLVAASFAIAALLVVPLLSDATRAALLSRLRSPSWGFGQRLRGPAGTLTVSAAVFLLVAGIGGATSYFAGSPQATASGDTSSISRSHSPNGELLASLKDYTRSIGAEEPAPAAAASKLLPDVNTMTERLAARLEAAPDDVKGWRMLGWSYFN